jgi:hypothetical protein
MRTKQLPVAVVIGFVALFASRSNAGAQVFFLDSFEQFANGTDLTSANYVPASGPSAASVATSVQNGSPTITATHFLDSTWALFDNSVVTNKNQYKGFLSAVQTNQPLQVTWKMWIQATNSGPGMFLFSIPTSDPIANFNPPIVFLDTGLIVALTNGMSAQTPIGDWGLLAGTVMTNTLILDYPNRTFSYSLNGQALATLPLGAYFTNVVGAIYFNGFERSPGSLGNRFAIDDVTVALRLTPLTLRIEWSNSTPRLSVFGQISNRFVLEYLSVIAASNNWQSLVTNTLESNPFTVIDTDAAGSSTRFYRARLVP